MSSFNASYLSALIAAQKNSDAVQRSAQEQSIVGIESIIPTTRDQLYGNFGISNDSTIFTHLLQQRQAEEQRRLLLAQHLAAIGRLGIPNNYNEATSVEQRGIAALSSMRIQQLLQQQNLQQEQKLRELQQQQINIGLHQAFAGNALPMARPECGTVLPFFNQSKMDSVHLAKMVQQSQQQRVNQQSDEGRVDSAQQSENDTPKMHLAVSDSASTVPRADRKRKGRSGTFPPKLLKMLLDLEQEEGGSEIASFLPHGRAFAIHKPRDFEKSVMPKYFRMSRFSSFQRQLNLYDFQRITEGSEKGAYYHDLFAKDQPGMCTMMKRSKIKGLKLDKIGSKEKCDELSSHDGSGEEN